MRWIRRLAVGSLGLLTLLIGVLVIGPRFLPYQAHPVNGGSMEPAIHLGSVAVFVPAEASSLRVGDVILFNHPEIAGQRVMHRVVAVHDRPDGRFLETRGDANDASDPWEIRAEGAGLRFAFSIPYLGFLLAFVQTAIGRTALIIVSALLVGAWALVAIWRPGSEVAKEGT